MKTPNNTQPRSQKTAPSSLPLTLGRLWLFLILIAGLLGAAGTRAATSSTWTNAPADATWTNVLNWNSKAVPGTINNTANNGVDGSSIATFTNAITTYGSAANPIIPDDATVANGKARMLSQLNFDGPNCGAYVFNSTNVYAAQTSTTPETGVLSLCVGSSSLIFGSFIGSTVTNPQVFLGPVQIRLPSSTTGQYGFTNNATSTQATYYFSNLFLYPGGTSRGVTFVFAGSNTGTNTVALLAQSVNQSSAACGLRKEGAGTWILSGSNVFMTASTMTINDGTLKVENASAFGAGATTTVAVNSNGVLQIDNGVTLAQNNITLSGQGTVRVNGSATVNGIRVGTAAGIAAVLTMTSATDVLTVGTNWGGASDSVLNISGPGVVLLTNSVNTYVGKWSVNAGALQLSNSATLGSGANLNIAAGSTFDISPLGAVTYTLSESAFSASGTGTTTGSTAATIRGAVGETIDLATAAKAINLTYTPASFTGDATHPALYISQGILSLAGNAFTISNASGTALGVGTYTLIKQASGSIISGGSYTVVGVTGAGLVSGAVGTIHVNGSEVDLVVSAYAAQALVWTGGSANAIWDIGTNANWLSGTVASVFNNSDNVTFNSVGSTNPTVTLVGTLAPGSVTVDTSANTYTFAGTGLIGGSTALTKVGSGNLLLQTVNTYAGGTVVSNGMLSVGTNNAISSTGSGDVSVVGTGILNLNGLTNAINGLNGDGTVDNTNSSVALLNVGNNGNGGTFTGVIKSSSGALGINKVGSGIQTLSSANTYTGSTIITSGSLRVGNSNALGSGASFVTLNGGILDLNSSLTLGGLQGVSGATIENNSSILTNTLVIANTLTNVSVYDGLIADGTTGYIGVYVPTGTFRVDGVQNTYSGGTILASGTTLAVGSINPTSGRPGTGGIIASNGATISMPTSLNTGTGIPNTINTVDGASVYFTSAGVANAISGQFVGSATATNVLFGNISLNGTYSFSNFLGTVVLLNTNGNAVRFYATYCGGDNTLFDFEGGGVNTRDASTVHLGAITGNAGGIYNPTITPFASYWIGGKNLSTVFMGIITGSNNIVKVGSAKLTLGGMTNYAIVTSDSDANTFTNYISTNSITYLGTTTISNGVLALVAPANLNGDPAGYGGKSSSFIMAGTNAVLDLSSMGYTIDGTNYVTNSTLNLTSPQTLGGIGTIRGSVLAGVGVFLNPGNTTMGVNTNGVNVALTNGTGTGVLTVTNAIEIGGQVYIRLNTTNAINSDELVAHSFTIDGTATLLVTNIGPALANAAIFQLFNHGVSGFDSVTLPTLTGTNSWVNNLAVDGSITLVAPTLVTVNTNSPYMTNTFDSASGTLTLSWPSDGYVGFWHLLAQTNTTAAGLGTNWVEVTGTSTTNKVIVTPDKTKGTVFYRLVYP